MKNKNNLMLLLVAIVFLIGGYLLGKTNKQEEASTSDMNVSTTTNTTVIATTTAPAVKKTTSVIDTNNYARIGQRILINGVYVTPIKVAFDSRCPRDVQCIQKGDIDLGVFLESGSFSQNVIMTLDKPILFAGKLVTLVSASPAKVSTKTITQSEYRFVITVKK